MRRFSLDTLSVPLVQAPMAGGPSTPRLAAAVSGAGGLGSLAAGYLTADAVRDALSEYRSLTSAPVSLNIFVPESHRAEPADLDAFKAALEDWVSADDIAGSVPAVSGFNNDMYEEKLAVVIDERPEVVTFTFGLPEPLVVERLREVGILVGVTVTTADEGRAAYAGGADVLIAQGIEAGGHRAQFDQSHAPQDITTMSLVEALGAATPLPVIAAGGVDGPERAQRLLDRGAQAVQVGTLFLTTDEAGTKPTHRRALVHAASDGANALTTLTRVFTGRPARALENRFTTRMEVASVVGYPQVHFLTAGIRAAAARADDPDLLNLWAGTGHRGCRQESAAGLVQRFSGLTPDTSVLSAATIAVARGDGQEGTA